MDKALEKTLASFIDDSRFILANVLIDILGTHYPYAVKFLLKEMIKPAGTLPANNFLTKVSFDSLTLIFTHAEFITLQDKTRVLIFYYMGLFIERIYPRLKDTALLYYQQTQNHPGFSTLPEDIRAHVYEKTTPDNNPEKKHKAH